MTSPTLSPSDSASWREHEDVWRRGRDLCRTGGRCQPEAEDDDGPNDRRERHERLRASIRAHSASVTGMTDSLDMRTSGNEAKLLSALISASVTGRFSRFVRYDVDDRELSRGVGGIGIGVTCGFRDRDHGLLLAGVVVEDAVAAPDVAQVFLGERVSDACPDRLAVLLELVVPVVLRFFLHQPLRHAAIISRRQASGVGRRASRHKRSVRL